MKNQTGQSIIEFAIIAMLFFLVFFGIMEFGFLMYNQQIVTNAAREGARFGILARLPENKIDINDIKGKSSEYAENNLISFGDKKFDPQAAFESGENYCSKFQDKLTVTVRYDYGFLFLPFAKKTLGATAVMFCE